MSRYCLPRSLGLTKGPFNDIRTSVAHFSDYSVFPGNKPSTGVNVRPRIGDASTLSVRDVTGLNSACQLKESVSAGNVSVNVRSSINAMFSDRNICDGAIFDSFVKHRLEECNVAAIASLFRLSGKKSKSRSSDLLKQHLPAIASRLQTLSSSKWRNKDFSCVVYGLQCIEEKDAGYVTVLSIMTGIADRMVWDDKTISSKNISMMLYGLQRNHCEQPESLLFLEQAKELIHRCQGSLDAQAVGNALYGMQGLSSDSVEVRALISALVSKVAS